MTIVIDTGVPVAFVNAGDVNHAAGLAIMRRVGRGEFGAPVSLDYVLDEGATLLQKRGRPWVECAAFAGFFLGMKQQGKLRQIETLRLADEDISMTWDLFTRHYNRGLSFTDCALLQLAARLDAPIASFDSGFDGLVTRVAA